MPDPHVTRVLDAIQRRLTAGDDASLAELLELWAAAKAEGSWLRVCLLAHYIADGQANARAELDWDVRAVDAAGRADAADFERQGLGFTLDQLWPSLHLNIADAALRLGDVTVAEAHLRRAQTYLESLPQEGLGGLTRDAVARLGERLASRRSAERSDR